MGEEGRKAEKEQVGVEVGGSEAKRIKGGVGPALYIVSFPRNLRGLHYTTEITGRASIG